MPKIESAVQGIRENTALLALSVAVLTFIGGIFSGIGAAVWYLSTLATTEHVTATAAEALRPLDALQEAVDRLDGTVGDLGVTVAGLEGLRGTVDGLGVTVSDLGATVAGLEGLRGTVDSLGVTVSDLGATVAGLEGLRGTVDSLQVSVSVLGGAVETLSGRVGALDGTVQELDSSVDRLNDQFPLLVSCVIELHGPWTVEGVDGRPRRAGGRDGPNPEVPGVCVQASDFVNRQPAPGP